MIGVAILSITLVPALIPTFIRGRLRREEESWLVRTLIDIYKPVLTWAMPHRNVVLWLFAVLLILGAGLFPLNALLGIPWKTAYLIVFAVVTILTVVIHRRPEMATAVVREPRRSGIDRVRFPPDRRRIHAAAR